MRITLLHPDPERGEGVVTTDVEVQPGTPVAALRPALARLTGHPAWTSTTQRLAVADQLLDDTHVAGQPPLVHGCVLRLGRGRRPSAEEAMRADWHVGVVAGSDCGVLVGLPDRARVQVAPGLSVRRRHDRVYARAGRRWRRWRPDDELVVGPTTYAARRRTSAAPLAAEPERPRPTVAAWLAPAIGSVALAAALHQPLLLLVGLVGPLGALGSLGLRRRRRAVVDAVPADPAALVAATVGSRPDDTPVTVAVPWDDGGTVAVVGPRSQALPVARAIVLAALGSHLSGPLVVRSGRPLDWSWCVWVGPGASPLPGADALSAVVLADEPPDAPELARWRSTAPPGQRLVILAASASDVPAWCSSRFEVSRGAVRLHDVHGRTTVVARHAVSEETAEAQVRRAAGVRAAQEAHGDLPTHASLGAQPAIPSPVAAEVAAAWSRGEPGLRVALGTGDAGRAVSVDLVTDGPHTLVAGTTGAGKSELLTTIVLSLALTHPPERLSVVLVDFKGGTGLGAVAGLPHVLEHVTDLDAAHAQRVLSGLRAEVRRRERVLVAAGARDLVELDRSDPATPGRLLVVVDELRALTEDVPEASAALARLAAQGRALGVHLVLATQRPAGAIGADLRANVTLRVALRVADSGDSTDVLDVPDAALIDARTPGRALVRRGSRPTEAVQVARATVADHVPPVRLADPWPSSGHRWTPTAIERDVDAAAAWVAAAVEAARTRPATRTPWLPALPPVVALCDVDDGPGLPVGISDLPEEQRRGAVRWDAEDGHLLVLGGPRSGRSTTLVTVGLGALARGWVVHGVGLPDEAVRQLRAGDRHGTLGSLLAAADAVETARLLELVERARRSRTVLLVDRLDLVLAAAAGLARGAGADRLAALWRGGSAAGGIAVAATSDVGAVAATHAGAFRDRLVLPLADPVLDTLAGVPATFAGLRGTPGRAVHLRAGSAQLVQVALPPEPNHPARAPDPSIVRVRTLPARAPWPGPGTAAPGVVLLGPGGDGAEPVGVDVTGGLLIAGPPGSGRSTALHVVALGLAHAGHTVLRLGAATTGLKRFPDVHPSDAADLPDGVTVLVDDIDELEREDPALVGSLSTRLVATSTAQAAAHAYRGVLPALLRGRRVLVLALHDADSAELVGPRAPWLADAGRRTVGRGALVRGREVTPVQVYDPG